MGDRTTTVYDAVGQTISLIDERAHRFSFTYDAAGNKTVQIDPLERRQTFTYNADRTRHTRTDARGNRTTYLYDAGGNLTERQYPDGTRVTFSYDATGDRTMMANSTGRYTTTYDELSRRRSVSTPAGHVLTYSYDSLSRRAELDSPAGRFTYAYDANNRITLVRNPQEDRTTFSYDDASRRVVKALANGTRASFTYDAANQVTRLANLKSDGTTISSFSYKYDRAGNRTDIAEADGSRITYSYDATYRLTGEHRSGTSPYRNTYTYDPTSNRLLKNDDGARTTYAYDAANQLVTSLDASGTTTYTFDADGNQQLVVAPSGDRTTTTWDFENRTTLVELPDATRNTMLYEPEGLRVQLDDSTGTTQFVWDDQNYLIETDESDVLKAVYTNEPNVYGNLISQYRTTNGVWLPSYYHFDALGSAQQLTDSSEAITDTYLYNAWGELLASTGTTINPFRYVGQLGYYFDPDTGNFYIRARIYSSITARWTSVDPLGFVDGLNQYFLVFLPSGTDPSGTQSGILPPAGFAARCAALALLISQQLDTAEEREMWWHFVTGRGRTFYLSRSQVHAIAFGNADFLEQLARAREECERGNEPPQGSRISFAAQPPWVKALGDASLIPSFICTEDCDLCWSVKLEDTYDVNARPPGERDPEAERNVRIVRLAQLTCGWQDFPVRGYDAGGCD
ncbi:tRNA3(Ser)-specific nuclease WapA precursor [Maioricimonas rarisocia]|uniref:tRNA3(Ser)-specific nuclease WapA n=1 Tax=Maioricimonas rarisocia TaxID=2528026 RepID=A0A517ZAY7_9PLAN|nr:RHS repeat-associated core domain-containing protein [Maioricimonas rarisocia]QDU39654.1 tRNA3(Ser)-specific nuclease WapA precursor [Maioricimonas rarisocia]